MASVKQAHNIPAAESKKSVANHAPISATAATPSPKMAETKAVPEKMDAPASASKGTMAMENIVSKFAAAAKARAEAMTSEFGERAKDAFAKSNKLTEEAMAFNQSNIEAVVESTKIMASSLENLRDDSLSFARKSFEDGSAAFKSFGSVKSPAEFFQLYAENSRKAFDAAVAQGSKNTEFLIKMTNDSFAPLSNRMSVITAGLKSA